MDLQPGVYLSAVVGADISPTCGSLPESRGADAVPARFGNGAVADNGGTDGPRVFIGRRGVLGDVFTLEVSHDAPGRYAEVEAGLVMAGAMVLVEPPF